MRVHVFFYAIKELSSSRNETVYRAGKTSRAPLVVSCYSTHLPAHDDFCSRLYTHTCIPEAHACSLGRHMAVLQQVAVKTSRPRTSLSLPPCVCTDIGRDVTSIVQRWPAKGCLRARACVCINIYIFRPHRFPIQKFYSRVRVVCLRYWYRSSAQYRSPIRLPTAF